MAGPRFVDLRDPAAATLPCADRLLPSRSGTRHRLALPAMAPEIPFRGWIFLRWGDAVDAVRVPPAERLARLGHMRTVMLPPTDPVALLDLVSLPAWELVRPKDFSRLEEVGATVAQIARAS